MHIAVIGATGTIGSRVVNEALSRGHHVTALSRDASQLKDSRNNITWTSLDVLDPDGVAAVLPGLDVLISAFGPGNGAKDMADSIARSIADPTIYARVATALLTALQSHPRTRLIVVGGAASLEVEPGLVFTDSGELLDAALDQFGLPREYAKAMRAHGDALNVLRTSNRLWTYFSPAVEITPRRTHRTLPDRQRPAARHGRRRTQPHLRRRRGRRPDLRGGTAPLRPATVHDRLLSAEGRIRWKS